MGDIGKLQVPWASLAVVATFVSGTLLAPHAFDVLRPAEKDRAQALVGAELEVDARLWEDPFTAVRRYETERLQRCEKAKGPSSRDCDPQALAQRRSTGLMHQRLDTDHDGDIEESLVMAVLVPGNPFVGAEEARRRTRYAMLAGLQAERYAPDNAEHIGLMNIDLASWQADAPSAAKDLLLLPYELLSDSRLSIMRSPSAAQAAASEPAAPRVDKPRKVALLWIDESALPSPKLDALAYVMNKAIDCGAGHCPKLVLIGPSSSDALRTTLLRLKTFADAKRDEDIKLKEEVRQGYRLLAHARVFSSTVTVADATLAAVTGGRDVQAFTRTAIARVIGEKQPAPTIRFERTIASDERVSAALADELLQRMPEGEVRRIVAITESDSLYARSLSRGFRDELRLRSANDVRSRHDYETVFFFRGVDGVTAREGVDRPSAGSKNPDAPAAIEWPESRDQLDYLRRMVAELQRSESVRDLATGKMNKKIGAIGIFANDVHDKLLILQALHESFPDKVFFTTDMDARYLHPRTLNFTRNLVVASSLPLTFPLAIAEAASAASAASSAPALQPAPPAPAAASSTPAQRQLQAGTAPFRDVYQASTYVAARLASCVRLCEGIARQARAAIDHPTVYEIGRERAVPLAGLDLDLRRAAEPITSYTALLAALMLLVVGGLAVWPSTPALRHARRWLALGPGAITGPTARTVATLTACAVYAALLGVMAGSVVEALMPGRLGAGGVGLWGALGAATGLLAYPGWLGHATSAQRPWLRRALTVVGLAVIAWAAWQTVQAARPLSGEPMVWLQGLSGWPSHFINVLALLAGVVAIDVLGGSVLDARVADDRWLALPEDAEADERALSIERPAGVAPLPSPPWLERLYSRTLLSWAPEPGRSVEFATLWRRYLRRSGALPRVMRVMFWYLLALLAIGALFWWLTDHYVPEVPVRGHEHRRLIGLTMEATMLLLPLVVVTVADATMLAWRFITLLDRGRTLYPPSTVQRFARELGLAQQSLWCRPIAAEPAQRVDDTGDLASPGQPAHSLLDDWIDIQIVARRTRSVAPLVVAPFIMLALMVTARSRLFDNWALTWPIAASVALYVLWLGLLAVLLKHAAEKARSAALGRMNADLRWLGGCESDLAALGKPMERLIAEVQANRTGAFAPPFDQWFFKGLLVPLGGAGGAQLIEGLLMAR